MLKTIGGFVAGIVVTGFLAYQFGGGLMVSEIPSPYSVEETAARIQRNIQSLSETRGWALSGLRNPAAAVAAKGGNVPPTLLVEACSTEYSGPIMKQESSRILSILMPCTITVYKKDDGSTAIGLMNTALMGQLFGPLVADIMTEVAKDQKVFVTFDDSKPAPKLIKTKPGGGGSGPNVGGC